MKISRQSAEQLLKELLQDVVVVDDKDADRNVKIEDLVAQVSENLGNSIAQDIETKTETATIEKNTGRLLGEMRRAMARTFGIPAREFEGKEIKDIIELAKTAYDTNNNKKLEDWQKERTHLVADFDNERQALIGEWEGRVQAAEQKYIDRDITARVFSLIEKLPRKGGDLQEQAEMLIMKAKNTYDVRYNEQKQCLEFYRDGKQAMDDKNKPLTDEAFARMWADKAGILARDTRHISPKDVQTGNAKAEPGVQVVINNLPKNLTGFAEYAEAGEG